MSTVARAYIPKVEPVYLAFQQTAIANIPANALIARMTPTLTHRLIWAWLFSSAATFAVDSDLVLMSNGGEVYREKMQQFNTAAVNNKWTKNIAQVTSSQGGGLNQLFTYINNTQFAVSPFKFNIMADTAIIQVNNISGGPFDAGLVITSQAGI